MPPPKSTAGYTKAAQKIKYVRNRDLKLSGKELKEEARIQKGMSEGICIKCREKLQWRFQFNKYKPLKNIANCSNCHKKCITKAYRTLCDQCANEKNVCPGCCQDIHSIQEERKQRNEYLGIGEDETNENTQQQDDENNEGVEGENNNDDNNLKECHDNDSNDENMDEEDVEPGNKRGINSEQISTNVFTGTLSEWNSRRFDDIVATKYSKARVTGSTEDHTLIGSTHLSP